MQLRRAVCLALIALAAGFCAQGQQVTLAKVDFHNAGHLAPADLEAVAGVHAGEKVSVDQMRAAAQRLIDTGFFDDVSVDSKGTSNALTLIFLLKPIPAEQITQVSFANFVWLTPEELTKVVHQVAPLFHGELPESGTSLDEVDAALQKALAAKGVSNPEVRYEAAMPTSDHPVHRLTFRISRPGVVVHEVRLRGVEAGLAPQVQAAAGKLRGAPYVAGTAEETTLGTLLAPYRDAGYLEAQADDLHTALVSGTSDPVGVDLSAAMQPGPVYHVASVTFAETPLVSSAAFAAGAKLHPGDVASEQALAATLEPVEAVYQKQGYAEVYVDPGRTLDTAKQAVSYAFKVVPGTQYRLRSVSVVGLPPSAKADFDRGWMLKTGDLYDPGYVLRFLRNNSALPGLRGYAGHSRRRATPPASR